MFFKLFDRNTGGIDRLLRFYLGPGMIACVLPYWAPQTGWNWIGYRAVVPLLPSVSSRCGLSGLVGLSTCQR